MALPAAVPSIHFGFRQGWAAAWQTLIAAEIVFATAGLGHLLDTGRQLNDMSRILAGLLVITAIGLAVEKLIFGYFEKKNNRQWGEARLENFLGKC